MQEIHAELHVQAAVHCLACILTVVYLTAMKTFERIIEWVEFGREQLIDLQVWALLDSWCFFRFISLLGRDVSLSFLWGVFR